MVCNCELRVDRVRLQCGQGGAERRGRRGEVGRDRCGGPSPSLRLRPELVAVVAAIVSDEDEVSSSVGVGFGARHGMPQQRGLLHRQ